MRVKATRRCPQTTTFENEGEPTWGIGTEVVDLQPDALPLSQTGPLPPTPPPLTIFLVTVSELHPLEPVLQGAMKLLLLFAVESWFKISLEQYCLVADLKSKRLPACRISFFILREMGGGGEAEDTSLLVLWQLIRLSFI